MAIHFTSQPQAEVLNAYNNIIFEFTSNNINPAIDIEISGPAQFVGQLPGSFYIGNLPTLQTARAIVEVDGVLIELSPINNRFYIDLKQVIAMVMNRGNFKDSIAIPNGNIFNYQDLSLYAEKDVKFKVVLRNGGTEETTKTLKLLKSVYQLVNPGINHYVQKKLKILLPYTDQTAYATFWEESPFDFSLYSNADRTITIRNSRTLIDTAIALKKGVNRIYVSNGVNDMGFQDVMPLMTNHINELEFIIDSDIYLTLMLEKKSFSCGTYLKWFNPNGGWSYWKFNPVEIETTESKNNKLINKDLSNLRDATRNYTVISKQVNVTRELKTGMLSVDQQLIVETILRSPKVYLLNNNPYQQLSIDDFKEVKVSDAKMEINNKLNKRELKIEIEMPSQYIQSYAS